MKEDQSVVRGVTLDKCPFIAIKVNATDHEGKLIGVFVEAIFKRYDSVEVGESYTSTQDECIKALNNDLPIDKMHHSFLYNQTWATDEEIRTIKKLLDGEKVCICRTYLKKV